jgi:hypothetical protein
MGAAGSFSRAQATRQWHAMVARPLNVIANACGDHAHLADKPAFKALLVVGDETKV